MAGTDSIREAIETLSAREKKLLEELNQLRVSIRTLKQAAGIELTPEEAEAPEVAMASSPEASFEPKTTNGFAGKLTVRPDEFFGMTHAEASRRYLKKVGHAVSFEELVGVLQKGGCKLSGSDPKKVLYISLIRNSKDFVPPQPGFVGLKEFYPARARATGEQRTKKTKRPPKKQSSQSKKGSKRKEATSLGKKADEAAPETPKEPKQVPLAVHEFLSDKRFHPVEEIVAAVRQKLGESVPKVSIHGALSSKKVFEKNQEGMYRLLN